MKYMQVIKMISYEKGRRAGKVEGLIKGDRLGRAIGREKTLAHVVGNLIERGDYSLEEIMDITSASADLVATLYEEIKIVQN